MCTAGVHMYYLVYYAWGNTVKSEDRFFSTEATTAMYFYLSDLSLQCSCVIYSAPTPQEPMEAVCIEQYRSQMPRNARAKKSGARRGNPDIRRVKIIFVANAIGVRMSQKVGVWADRV